MNGLAALLGAAAVGLGLVATASGEAPAASVEAAGATAPGAPHDTETVVEGHTTYAVLETTAEDYGEVA